MSVSDPESNLNPDAQQLLAVGRGGGRHCVRHGGWFADTE